MVSIPKKSTDEVDWTTPIRNIIAQSYGESPDNYAADCVSLQRCRQDSVRGAGSDMTARDLLYKYFGQLELLELRFSEIKVNFAWRDAFTNKLTTQSSIAFEKASVLFQIASTHSAIAASQNRSDPEGLKRSFYYFKTCAGMLTYINENFLHAPSTDLSRDVVKFLVNIILAQATEVFFEKCADEKKGAQLVSKIGAQAASMYSSLSEEVKEFMGKGIFDRNWVTMIQTKAKYFSSLTHYYRAQADTATSKYGEALVRYNQAESLAKEANRTAQVFANMFVTNMSPNLPADAGPSLLERTKAHLAICTERKNEAQRENDLIYNAILPSPDALPAVEKLVVANPIPIQEVFGSADVQKVIGADIFGKLIPLSVHESASVYSEEKAKLVRGEVEKSEGAEGEIRSVLEGLGIKDGIARFKAMAEGEIGGEEEIPLEVRRWRDDISLVEEREPVSGLFSQLTKLKEEVKRDLEGVSRELEIESRDCEMMRVKYEHNWSQEPSASLTKSIRQELRSNLEALEAAASSDGQVHALWNSVHGEVQLLLSPQLESVFRASTDRAGSTGESLLDLDVGQDTVDDDERNRIGNLVADIEERRGRLNKIGRERSEILRELKDKIQTDDVSHLLLLNKRNTGVEPSLFASELEKFRPYQQRLVTCSQHQQTALQEITSLWKALKDLAGRGPGAQKWEERERRKKDTIRRFSRARDVYMEVRDGLAKGLQFYSELTELGGSLAPQVRDFVDNRRRERDSMASRLEVERRLSSTTSSTPAFNPPLAPKPPRPPPPPSDNSPQNLDFRLNSMNLNSQSPASWQQPTSYTATPPPPPAAPQQMYNNVSYSSGGYGLPPPPPAPSSRPAPAAYSDPYASLGSLGSSQFSANQPSASTAPSSASYGYSSPPPSQPYGSASSHQYANPPTSAYNTQQQSYQHQPTPPPPPQQQGGFPPPPPPQGYGRGPAVPPPPGQQPQYGYSGSLQYQGQGGYSQGYGR